MPLLEFSRWHPSVSALISWSTIKSLNFYAALRFFIWSLSGHRPENVRVRYLETRGALNRRLIWGISLFLLVIQSVQLLNTQSSVSFQRNHLTTESKSAFNSDKKSFLAYRKFKWVYSLTCNSPLHLIEGWCLQYFSFKYVLSHQPNPFSLSWPP